MKFISLCTLVFMISMNAFAFRYHSYELHHIDCLFANGVTLRTNGVLRDGRLDVTSYMGFISKKFKAGIYQGNSEDEVKIILSDYNMLGHTEYTIIPKVDLKNAGPQGAQVRMYTSTGVVSGTCSIHFEEKI